MIKGVLLGIERAPATPSGSLRSPPPPQAGEEPAALDRTAAVARKSNENHLSPREPNPARPSRRSSDLGSGYFAFGEDDLYAIVDLPDNVTAAALGITGSASGVGRTKTTALLTVEEVDRALEKSVNYRPPGG